MFLAYAIGSALARGGNKALNPAYLHFFTLILMASAIPGKESVVLMCILFDKFNGAGTFFTEMRVYMRE